jgi:hypothetical protein
MHALLQAEGAWEEAPGTADKGAALKGLLLSEAQLRVLLQHLWGQNRKVPASWGQLWLLKSVSDALAARKGGDRIRATAKAMAVLQDEPPSPRIVCAAAIREKVAVLKSFLVWSAAAGQTWDVNTVVAGTLSKEEMATWLGVSASEASAMGTLRLQQRLVEALEACQ